MAADSSSEELRRAMGVSHPCWKAKAGASGHVRLRVRARPPGVQAQFPLPILCDPAQGTRPVSDYFPVAPSAASSQKVRLSGAQRHLLPT